MFTDISRPGDTDHHSVTPELGYPHTSPRSSDPYRLAPRLCHTPSSCGCPPRWTLVTKSSLASDLTVREASCQDSETRTDVRDTTEDQRQRPPLYSEWRLVRLRTRRSWILLPNYSFDRVSKIYAIRAGISIVLIVLCWDPETNHIWTDPAAVGPRDQDWCEGHNRGPRGRSRHSVQRGDLST